MRNNLDRESSLYLQQHQANPVWWQAWGPAAWAQAREENKPVIISIGYSSCHWCHVMEHQCFEDVQVAEAMNASFICIKVDREERPDVDAIYMDAVHMMGLQGGWPLNVFALPDGSPFYGGTYFPKNQWLHMLHQIAEAYKTEPEDLKKAADGFRNALQRDVATIPTTSGIGIDWEKAISKIKRQFDAERGGVGQAPKFPMPNLYQFLMLHAFETQDEELRKLTFNTLTRMAFGGIYDHVGGGFCRYSTDADWHIPHFEKMLYDNGQLLSVYAKAYQLGADLCFRDVCMNMIEFLNRDMRSPKGAFYGSIDADSEGEEGKFYAWSKEEFDEVIGSESSKYLSDFYGITSTGNWEHGKNVLKRHAAEEDFSIAHNIGESQLHRIVVESKSHLLLRRSTRIAPVTDTKIITAWNALTINGLTDVHRYMQQPDALQMAVEACEYIFDKCFYKGELQRLPGQRGKAPAYLDDYATLANALLNLYQATFQQKFIEQAKGLLDKAFTAFAPQGDDAFFYLNDGTDKTLIARHIERFDNVVPSSNSMLCQALLTMHHFTLEENYLDLAQKMLNQSAPMLIEGLRYASNWAFCHKLALPQVPHFQIIGPEALVIREKIDQLGIPIYLVSGALSYSVLGALQGKMPPPKKTAIWLCRDGACLPPVYKLEDLELN